MTIHAELMTIEDINDELEVFNLLSRISNFRDARSFFNAHLRANMSNPYVFVQYAEMLFNQNNYKSIELLDDNCIFPKHLPDELGNSDKTTLQTLKENWWLIEAAMLCCTQYEVGAILEKTPPKAVSILDD